MSSGVFFSLGLLEGLQNFVSNCGRIGDALQSRRELRKFIVAEVAVSRSGGQHQVIVAETHALAINIIDDHHASDLYPRR